MSSSKVNEIQKIIDLFKYDNEFLFWNIKTKITSIVDIFFNNYINIPTGDRINSINIITENDSYKILCNNYSITPSSNNDVFVKKTTLKQYLKILEIFEIIQKNSEDSKNYLIIDEKFLNVDLSFESEFLIERIISKFDKLWDKAKEIFYSVFIVFLIGFSDDNEDEFKLKTHRGLKIFKKYEIINIAKDCGYNFMTESFKTYGRSLEEIYVSILHLITKK